MRTPAVFLVVIFTACGPSDPAPEGTEGGACYRNRTCNAGLLCDDGTCVTSDHAPREPGTPGGECFRNLTCHQGLQCVDGRCADPVPPRPPPSSSSSTASSGPPPSSSFEPPPSSFAPRSSSHSAAPPSSSSPPQSSSSAPVDPPAISARAARWIDAAASNGCILTSDQDGVWLSCWGGSGPVLPDPSSNAMFVLEPLSKDNWRSLSVGEAVACGLDAAAALYCWGDNSHGQLGSEHAYDAVMPPTPVAPLQRWQQVSVGAAHACAIDEEFHLFCWGRGVTGVSCDAGTRACDDPVQVDAAAWIAVAAGDASTCGIRQDRSLWCWGDNADAQVGVPGAVVGSPTELVVTGVTGWSAVSIARGAGTSHACAISDGGEVYCWGANGRGQAGAATGTTVPAPTRVNGPTDVVDVVTGGNHTCALGGAGTVWCWGGNDQGQLGIGSVDTARHPLPATVAVSGAEALVAGNRFSCAATETNLYCWGINDDYQLGRDLAITSSDVPIPVFN